jgi:hypothetical protein
VANCAELKPASGTSITASGTYEGIDYKGAVGISASNVTLKHDCVEVNGNEVVRSAAVILEQGADNFTISDSTVRGLNTTTESVSEGLRNAYSNPGASAVGMKIENVGNPLFQLWTLRESYAIVNGMQHKIESGEEHSEDWYVDRNDITAIHDTLLNPSKQTADLFAESGGGPCTNHETVENSLLAGGGYVFYFCQHTSGDSGSSISIKNNRIARRVCTKGILSNWEGRGGYGCSPEGGGYFALGEGTDAYFPYGGFFGVVSENEGVFNKGQGWEGNYWDDSLQPVQESGAGS